MDNFYEQLETVVDFTNYKMIKMAMYVFGVLAFLCLFTVQIIPLIFSVIIAVVAFFMKKKAYVEYEYVLTNGVIDIDAIYDQKKRKRLISFDAKDMELLAEANSVYVKDFSNKPDKELKCFQAKTTKIVYIAMITGGVTRLQFMFTPDKGFLDLCYKYNPRAVKRAIR
ncbi:MAG: hypothetical protein H7Y18_09020 [Clostridiaceae bacterium]|nr:hypothetical protein [Clostridiaceae bacterium]